MRIVHTMSAAREAQRGLGTVGLVPTMGYFHEGHLSLMERSVSQNDCTVVSLFVNPLQFDESSDFDGYPNNQARDVRLAEEAGVDILLVPSLDEMFPVEPLTRVNVTHVTELYEGAYRPGHLSGVATAVTKLLAGVQPDRAYFGRKDAQQLAMVRRMAVDLSFPVEIVECPLIRECDGLALSSRNILLGQDRSKALGLSRGLFVAADVVEAGERSCERVEAIVVATSPGIEFQYVAFVGSQTMQPILQISGESVLVVAASLGSIRLVDNIWISSVGDRLIADRGQRLDGLSMMTVTKDSERMTGDE